MYQGFNSFPQQNSTVPKQNMNAFANSYPEPSAHDFPYYDDTSHNNPRSTGFQNQNERIQVPSHIQFLFNSNDNSSFDARTMFNLAGGAHNLDGGHPQPSNVSANSNNFLQFPGFTGRVSAQPEQTNNNNYGFPGESNTSNLSGGNSRNISLNNTSSNTSQRMDSLPSDRRNASSRMNMSLQNEDHIKPINEDIILIERIEPSLNQISMNHNRICPFCSQAINIRQANFQQVSAFFCHTTNRYYLTHFDCFLKSKTDGFSSKLLSLSNVGKVSLKTTLNGLGVPNPQSLKNITPKAYFISLEGYHPISSFLLFRVDKLCNTLEQLNQNSQMLRIDLSRKSTSIFEPNQYRIPYNEFKLVVTIHLTHSEEDPYVFDFLVDLSSVNITSDQINKFIEMFYSDGNNQITIGSQIVFDSTNNPKNDQSLDTSIQSAGSTPMTKPEFGINLFLILKQFSTSLPLTRREIRGKSSTSLESNTRLKQTSSPLKQQANKFQLNPNAPLFGNMAANILNKPPMQQNPHLVPQNLQQGGSNSFDQQAAQPRGPFNPNLTQGNPNFNAPLFPSNFAFDMERPESYPENDSSPQGNVMPPGLGRMPGPGQNFPSQPFFSNQQFPESPYDNRKGSFEVNNNSGFNKPISGESFDDPNGFDRPATPDSFQQNEAEIQNMRGRVKPQISNLYTAVLGRARKDSSLSNSPSLNKIQNQYFSNVSTPQSAYDPNPISMSMNKFIPAEFQNEAGDDSSANAPLTEEMINNFKLEDYRGRLTEFAKTYNGSRILQKFFPKANQQEIEIFIHEIQDKIDELMLDPYANYMFQTLAQSCSSEQRYYLLQKIAPAMIRIAKDRKGTHSLQAVVSLINRDAEEQLIKQILEGHIPELSFDAQATHLIQKLVVSLSLNNIGFIYEPVIQKFPEFANNSFGLCVLKQLMTKVEKIPQMKQKIIDLLYIHLEDLIQSPFGNYAVQHALDIYPQGCEKILDKIIDKIVQYSNQKFSSNVIEKCFMNTTPEYKRKFVNEITKSDRLVELMKNKYGNYVILKILSTSDAEEKKLLAQSLLRNVNLVNVPKYKNRWIQFLEENPMKIPILNAQTIKPSLFKTSGAMSDSAGNNSFSDTNSPRTGDGWGQDPMKKGSKDLKEEKSQFYKDRNRGNMPNMQQRMNNPGQEWDEIDDSAWSNNYQGGFEAKNNKNMGQGQAGNVKKNKNPNQKFYEKNQHHPNKGGYNNFY